MKRPPRGLASDPSRAGVDPGERVLLVLRPSAWTIITDRWQLLAGLILVAALCSSMVPTRFAGAPIAVGAWIADACILLALAALLSGVLIWAARVHVLTDRRAIIAGGVLRRVVAAAPLGRVQQISVIKQASERSVGIGSLLIETAGSHVGGVAFAGVPRPERVAAIVRAAARRSTGSRRGPPAHTPGDDGLGNAKPDRPRGESVKNRSGVLVLGIAGGIGAGKSAVAAALARLGCVVVDSDRESKAALDRPEVKRTLTEWWGTQILDPQGVIDRRKVAEIVFGDPEQRRRLEALVHPIVRGTRAELVRRAASAGVRVVIVDAPLLFEAGVDQECDAVLFVDAPLQTRLDRVRRTRGWSDEELARREAAQLAIAEKRLRSRYVVVNDGDVATLEQRTLETLNQAKADFGVN